MFQSDVLLISFIVGDKWGSVNLVDAEGHVKMDVAICKSGYLLVSLDFFRFWFIFLEV